MAKESSTQLGSGTIPFTSAIRYGQTLSRGTAGTDTAQGYRLGTNVVVINPEDQHSSPFWATSGVTIAADATVELASWFKTYATGVHRRNMRIYNVGPGTILIGPSQAMTNENSFPVYADDNLDLPLMDNIQVFARASGTETDVRYYEY